MKALFKYKIFIITILCGFYCANNTTGSGTNSTTNPAATDGPVCSCAPIGFCYDLIPTDTASLSDFQTTCTGNANCTYSAGGTGCDTTVFNLPGYCDGKTAPFNGTHAAYANTTAYPDSAAFKSACESNPSNTWVP